jgi:hypothetical protein
MCVAFLLPEVKKKDLQGVLALSAGSKSSLQLYTAAS